MNFALAGSTTVTGVAGWSLLMALVMGRLGTAYVLQKLCMIIWATYPGDPRIESTFLTYWKSYAGVGKGEKPKEEPIASARDTVYAYPYLHIPLKEKKNLPDGRNPSCM